MSRGPGQVITFYAFKGGIGRSGALANVAMILAASGKRVLMVDWDLDEPGLHRYFPALLADHKQVESNGVLDMLLGHRDAAAHARLHGEAPSVGLSRAEGEGDEEWKRRSLDALIPAGITADLAQFVQKLDRGLGTELGGELDFLGPGVQEGDYAELLAGFDACDFVRNHGGREYLAGLRDALTAEYDYVLIDGRTGFTDHEGVCTTLLPDIVVVGFNLSSQLVHSGAMVARDIKARAGREVRIVPVAMHVEATHQQSLEAGRAYARRHFDEFLTETDEAGRKAYWARAEIPYRPHYAYEESLAAAKDPTVDRQWTMMPAHEGLTALLTDGDVTEFRGLPEQLVRRLQGSGRRPSRTAPESVAILHAPHDSAWAEWLRDRVQHGGIRVVDHRGADFPEVETVIVLLSEYLDASPDGLLARRLGEGAPVTPTPPRSVVGIQVGDSAQALPFLRMGLMSLVGLDAKAASQAVWHQFGVVVLPYEESLLTASGARFPGMTAVYANLPARDVMFTGRKVLLGTLLDRLTFGTTAVPPLALHGPHGIGKTAVAQEYAHMHQRRYDITWWINAESTHTAQASLVELANRLGIRGSGALDTINRLFDALRRGEPYSRWLLVYDNAQSPEALAGLVAANGPGHVVITSPNAEWENGAETMEVREFETQESVALLDRYSRRTLPGEQEALRQLAERLGNMPNVVYVAAKRLQTGIRVHDYLTMLSAPERILKQVLPGKTKSIAATYQDAFSVFEEDQAAVRLLNLLAYVSQNGVSTRLLYSRGMRAAVFEEQADTDRVAAAGVEGSDHLETVLIGAQNSGLLSIDHVNESVRVQRPFQEWLRSRLDDQEREETRTRLLRVLAAYSPSGSNPDSSRHDTIYEELSAHLEPAGALLRCDDPAVRRWLVRQVRYLWRADFWEASERLARDLLSRWEGWYQEADDPYRPRLAVELANALRLQGQYEEAHKLDSEALGVYRSMPDWAENPYALAAARSYGGDLRALGRFQDALASDMDTYDRYVARFGEEHPETLKAATNLALSWYLVGSPQDALERDEKTLRIRRRALEDDDSQTWRSAISVGTYAREAGQLSTSIGVLQQAHERLRHLRGDDSPLTLRAAKNLGVTRLRDGDPETARALHIEALKRYQRLGDTHPDTLACSLALAADLAALGTHRRLTAGPGAVADTVVEDCFIEAVQRAQECVEAYTTLYTRSHPFTCVSRHNLSLYLLGSGKIEEALGHAEFAAETLQRTLGDAHPYTVLAYMNQANCLAAAKQQLLLLRSRYLEVYDNARHIWGTEHWNTAVAAANLADAVEEAQGPEAAEAYWAEVAAYRTKLSSVHPLRQALEHRPFVRIGIDIEVPAT